MRTLLDKHVGMIRKTALVAKELARYHIDIAALSETQFVHEGSLQELGSGYTFSW